MTIRSGLGAAELSMHSGKSLPAWGYCVFGKVTKGLDVVYEIENVSVGVKMGHGNVPVTPIILKRAVTAKH